MKYGSKTITVVRKGRVLHRFRRIQKLQAYNRIEGYLNFVGSSSPSGRTFPGYGEHNFLALLLNRYTTNIICVIKIDVNNVGLLRVGWTGVVQYIQTIVDPMVI